MSLDNAFIIRLTFAVHRVAEKLPKEEFRKKIEDLANEILVDLICLKPAKDKIGELEDLFEAVQEKNWINPVNFSILKREYAKIKESWPPASKGRIGLHQVKDNKPTGLSPRQEKIFQLVSSNGRTRLGDLLGVFQGVHRRTILRDVDKLVEAGLIVRNGDGRGTYYKCHI